MDNIRKEKEMYLNEFRYLKEKYQETIDKLENELHKIKLLNKTLVEDNITYKVKYFIFIIFINLQTTSEHYKSRMQELLDLHEVAALD